MSASTLSEKRARYYCWVFRISAIWNFLVAAIFLFFYRFIFTRFHMEIPEMEGWHHMTWALIAIFGYGYWQVSKDFFRNKEIVKLGIMGKSVFFILFTQQLIVGDVHFMVWLGSVGDLICGLLFAEFLFHTRKMKAS